VSDQETVERLKAAGVEVETVGNLLGDEQVSAPVAPVTPPRHEDQPEWPGDGIFFGMPEEEYHAIFACSTSILKLLSASSMDAWANSPLNLDREEQEQKDYFDFGNAIHTLVLEGEETYASRYVIGLGKGSFEGLLETTDHIKAKIVELGHKPCTKGYDDITRSAKKEDWIAQLHDLDPDIPVWTCILDDFEEQHAGAEIVTHKIDRRVRIAARMILAQPDIAENFRDGFAEVSVFWHCPVTGCPMKARFDYLKLRRIVDLKSFSNKNRMPIDRAIERTIASMRYNVQHVVYDEAVEAAKQLIRELGPKAIRVPDWLDGMPFTPEFEFALKLAEQPAPDFMFVFQQTGIAPVTRGKIMPRESMGVFGTTQRRVEELKRLFVANCEVYGAEPWLDIQPVSHIEDEALPMWATEI
jgi:hypothetical protein